MKKSRARLTVLFASVLAVTGAINPAVSFAKETWQLNIDWSANDTGHPNCVHLYIGNPLLQPCLVYGNRYCVTDIAIEAAYRGYDQFALNLMADVTQCHNAGASNSIRT
jgi:hypothetical protein